MLSDFGVGARLQDMKDAGCGGLLLFAITGFVGLLCLEKANSLAGDPSARTADKIAHGTMSYDDVMLSSRSCMARTINGYETSSLTSLCLFSAMIGPVHRSTHLGLASNHVSLEVFGALARASASLRPSRGSSPMALTMWRI